LIEVSGRFASHCVFRSWQGILQQSALADSGTYPSFQPRLSPVMLGIILRLGKSDEHVVSEEVDKTLLEMLKLEPNFSWSCWEKFLAFFESLRSQLYALESERVVCVSKLYPGAIALDPSVLDKQIPVVSRSVEFVGRHLVPSRLESVEYANKVVLPTSGNSGSDSAISHSDNDWILIEVRYSEQDGHVKTEDIGQKYKSILKKSKKSEGVSQFS
jgi:hypothetical protein